MPRRALSIAVKFPVFVLALLLVVIWGLASYFNIALKRDLERLLSAQQFSAVSVIAASIEQETRLRLQALDELAQTIGKRHLTGSSEQLDQFLWGNLTITALFNGGLLVLGSDGIKIADTLQSPGPKDQSFADSDYFIATLERRKSVIGAPRLGKITGRPLVAITAPVFDADGQIAGVLAGITYLDADNFMSRIVGTYGSEHGGVLELSINNFTILNQCVMINVDFTFLSNSIT
jgi:hypothetical protein